MFRIVTAIQSRTLSVCVCNFVLKGKILGQRSSVVEGPEDNSSLAAVKPSPASLEPPPPYCDSLSLPESLNCSLRTLRQGKADKRLSLTNAEFLFHLCL